MHSQRYMLMLALTVACLHLMRAACIAAQSSEVVTVQTGANAKVMSFQPLRAFGSTVDKEPAGSIPSLYAKHNIKKILDSGLGWLSYRLYTELSDQDWHWNPAGSFSAGTSGYWTSYGATSTAPISDSFGYRLPHRGNTTDQGNNESYSRLDDGDPQTYWKSDPYLTSAWTHESDTMHPQWVVIDLDRPQDINELKISWAAPYATQFTIDYWIGDDAIGDPGTGTWKTVAIGANRRGIGRSNSLSLGPHQTIKLPATKARFWRILMSHSSNTCDTHGSSDKRNCAGYAIAELALGFINSSGTFRDAIIHRPCGGVDQNNPTCGRRQTVTYVSSVDPWHAASDRVRNQEQPGLDLIARSGLTRGLPAMYPVPMLYSTPENAVAQIRYLQSRGYPIWYIELGEEPDGQYTTPEDDAALYVQWARALHKFNPALRLGGPVFSGVDSDLQTWPDADGNISWLNRFLNYLRSHRALNEFAFMSFEHYPTDNGCVHGAELERDLLREPSIVKGVVNAWRSDGVPSDVPLYITEANFSSVNFSQTPMQIEGALWLADYIASALSNGVSGAVYYQDEPVPLSQNKGCPSDWGNLTMFVADGQAQIRANGAQFYANQMLTTQWVQPGSAWHDLYRASTNIARAGYPLVTAYAVRRPDNTWSVLLVNKDTAVHHVAVAFQDSISMQRQTFAGPVTVVSFGSNQYVWRSRGAASAPNPDQPPATTRVSGGADTIYEIPARSITVLRGTIAPAP